MSSSQHTLIAALQAQFHWRSPLGGLLLARTGRGLAGAWFDGQKDHPGPLPQVPTDDDDPLLRATIGWFEAYFGQDGGHPAPPALDLIGTPFQCAVWHHLLQIAPGQTTTYGRIAQAVGSPAAVRAVGAAVGRNPVSVIVPCHRVVGHDGSLTGYAGGLDRKRALLDREGAPLPTQAGLFGGAAR